MTQTKPTTAIAPTDWADAWAPFDRWFDTLHGEFFDAFGLAPRTWFFAAPATGSTEPHPLSPRTDVVDTGSAYQLSVEVPGIPKEQLDIRVKGPSVEIRGSHGQREESKRDGVLHRERSYLGFYRAVTLPEPVLASEAKAHVTDGVLVLELPKEHPVAEPQEVKVPVA
jgi:HSP20 family protein